MIRWPLPAVRHHNMSTGSESPDWRTRVVTTSFPRHHSARSTVCLPQAPSTGHRATGSLVLDRGKYLTFWGFTAVIMRSAELIERRKCSLGRGALGKGSEKHRYPSVRIGHRPAVETGIRSAGPPDVLDEGRKPGGIRPNSRPCKFRPLTLAPVTFITAVIGIDPPAVLRISGAGVDGSRGFRRRLRCAFRASEKQCRCGRHDQEKVARATGIYFFPTAVRDRPMQATPQRG